MFERSLTKQDPDMFVLIQKEKARQEEGLELIASENYASLAVIEAQGSILTNKYAEGFPRKRYYGGCEFIDDIETLGLERAKTLFKAKYANVQPHSGSQANMAAYFSLLSPGDKILGMNLAEGGHLTHGSPVNFSGKLFDVVFYGLNPETERIDYQAVAEIAKKEHPKLIIAGASAYPRFIEFDKFREIADSINAYLVVDMAHIAGLVATGLHPDPLPYAHIVTSTTHKTLRGPRGGLLLTNDQEIAKKMNSNIFPGIQGGPLEHVIAAKGVAFHEALQPGFKAYQEQVLENAEALGRSLLENNLELVTGGSDNHLLLVKTDSVGLTGKEAEICLEKAGITCNKNMIPQDKRSPFITSGIRLGTPAITTRGLSSQHMFFLGEQIVRALNRHNDEKELGQIKAQIVDLCREYPVYRELL